MTRVAETATPSPVRPRASRPALRGLSRTFVSREFSVFAALAILLIVTTIANPRFLSPQGTKDLLLNSAIFVVMAVGEALVIITRNVDLSVGSILGLTAFSTGATYNAFPHMPVIGIFVIGVVLGAILGAVNGLIVTAAKVPALVITLGTLYIYRGINNAWAGSTQYFIGNDPPEFGNLSVASVLGLPLLALIALVITVVFALYLFGSRSGRDLYAIGSDPVAAQLFGIKVTRRVIGAFVASGALSGLAGVLYASRFNSVGADTGTGYELQIVAAVVVGGVAIFGGSGTVVGAAIGAVLLTTMTGALAALNVSKFWQQAIVGILIIAAILITKLISLRNAKKLRVSEAKDV
ncbi:ABC transporter permease [Frondihabitans cladoniiphilus]|uniref:Autoinducer 2 import system permease protein LsrC n=1 Tax=Frondihabitans cladoniiphilus TaxID=715785 RepID=A0ABP8W552_9MICO